MNMKKDSSGVKERPILFSGPSVRAILEGRKTQTRRIIKLPKMRGNWEGTTAGGPGCFMIGKDGERITVPEMVAIWNTTTGHQIASPYQPGDRLWVRETLKLGVVIDKTGEQSVRAYYAATCQSGTSFPWEGDDTRETIPSIYMPRWASRITLEITGVRVERLQDINEADARAEGVEPLFTEAEIEMAPDCYMEPMPYKNYLWHGNIGRSISAKQSDEWAHQFSDYKSARGSFSSLWESINGPGSWDADPWVWVIEFRRVNANVLET